MFFTPPQGFSVIPKCFHFEVIALRTRNRDRILALVHSHGDFKTYRSVGRTIRDRIGLNEIPIQHRDNIWINLRKKPCKTIKSLMIVILRGFL